MEFTHIPDYLDIDLKVHRRGEGVKEVFTLLIKYLSTTLYLLFISLPPSSDLLIF